MSYGGVFTMTLQDGSVMPGTVRATIQETEEGTMLGALSVTPAEGQELTVSGILMQRFTLHVVSPFAEDAEDDMLFQCDPIGATQDAGGFVVLFMA